MSGPAHDRYDALYLSPHLDDVVLSCGGQIHQRVERGESVLVVTVFAGDPPPGPPGALEAKIREWTRLEARTAMALRRAEDIAACVALGAEALHWHWSEAPSRRRALESLDELFQPPSRDDAEHENVAEQLRDLPRATTVVAPLTVGDHLDHHVVRRAAESVWGDGLVFYEDFPYARQPGAVAKTLGERRSWRATTTALDAADVEARIDAIDCYLSQVKPLFAPRLPTMLAGWAMRRAVRQAVRQAGGERMWQRAG